MNDEKKELANKIINFMNELIDLDYKAIESLVEHRVPCNEGLANHSTIQTARDDKGKSIVGLLGILNGIVGKDEDGWGFIAANFEKDGCLIEFLPTPPRKVTDPQIFFKEIELTLKESTEIYNLENQK